VRHRRADTHYSVVDVLWKFVAEGRTNVRVRFPDEIVGGCEPGEVGQSLHVPHDDATTHGTKVWHKAGWREPGSDRSAPPRLAIRHGE